MTEPQAITVNVTDEAEAAKFAVWLQAAAPTRLRQACWTALGLDYVGVTPEWAAANRLEGWPHE